MKAKIAVATVSGKAYFLTVNELKRKNAVFLSVTPNEPIPVEVKVVITTKKEKHLISHENTLVYDDNTDPEALVNEALKIAYGKESYEKVVIGIDPGEVSGLVVLADGKIIETENCFSIEEILHKVKSTLKNLDTSAATVSVKIGDGVPTYKERLLGALDEALPSNVVLEVVSEAGTNRYLNGTKHRRGLRDIVSATRIAGRAGYMFPRSKAHEPNS
jgi:hypothetical protein